VQTQAKKGAAQQNDDHEQAQIGNRNPGRRRGICGRNGTSSSSGFEPSELCWAAIRLGQFFPLAGSFPTDLFRIVRIR
jgi:hypothetical protein